MVRWLALNWRLALFAVMAFAIGVFGIRMNWIDRRLEQEKEYRKTRERIDDALIYGDDPAAARRWLRERRPSGAVFRHRDRSR